MLSPRNVWWVVWIICFQYVIFNSEALSTRIARLCFNTTYSPDSIYQTNLNRLLITLSANADNNGFYNASEGNSAPDVAYGLFLCRGDVSTDVCRECVISASMEIINQCPRDRAAVIWYDECALRYSNRSFVSTMDQWPWVYVTNGNIVTEETRFNQLLGTTLVNLANQASNETSNFTVRRWFQTVEVNFNRTQAISTSAMCTPDLSGADCNMCLTTAIDHLDNCCGGRPGASVFLPSCSIRYWLSNFLVAEGRVTRNTRVIVISTTVSVFIVIVLLGVFIVYCKRTNRKKQEKNENRQEIQLINLPGNERFNDYSRENFRVENKADSKEFPLIRLDVICAATQQFSVKNKLGEGGFGPVYKGTLVDGKEIAVKRLSTKSCQGLHEFKNEVTLISRLQHRNLVRLLGCCLEGNELLLVYDYMPNKSLDVFLFDSKRGAELDWKTRFSIINGISRGLTYLHEDSRLKIIHRDLKASNILLDHEMNPKISDFGMARIFGADQSEENTIRVVGTYGYMAPEYAMGGLISVKSDVFSFGVLLLEIISGKKNSRFYLFEDGETLLTYAWKLWCKGEGLTLMDLSLSQSCAKTEVMKSLHIGLLCVQQDPADRPTMSSVVHMLASDTATLPQPTEPAFSVGRVLVPSSQSQPSDKACSVNEMSISYLSPR